FDLTPIVLDVARYLKSECLAYLKPRERENTSHLTVIDKLLDRMVRDDKIRLNSRIGRQIRVGDEHSELLFTELWSTFKSVIEVANHLHEVIPEVSNDLFEGAFFGVEQLFSPGKHQFDSEVEQWKASPMNPRILEVLSHIEQFEQLEMGRKAQTRLNELLHGLRRLQ
ncbi:hypothetical protein OAO01_08935, partial [Oligoflexia bacterium]|nr:hypothetical protein [Oligoflexia bacterium]